MSKRPTNRRKYGESSRNYNSINKFGNPLPRWQIVVKAGFSAILIIAYLCLLFHYIPGDIVYRPVQAIPALLIMVWMVWHYGPHALRCAGRVCRATGYGGVADILIRLADAIEAW